jgi:hypothetical protein
MKLVSALVGLAALGGVALSSAAASAMPVAIPAQAAHASNVQQAAYVCNAWWLRLRLLPAALLWRLGLAPSLGLAPLA